jgi:KDO2-lipid IV(A) lauroyltransferase
LISIKKMRYISEACAVYPLYGFFAILPVDMASALGGFLGRMIGPRLAASRKALRNLQMALPNKTPEDYTTILRGVWDNLGRVMAEYPHLAKISAQRVQIINKELLREVCESGEPNIFFAAHLANWEVIAPTLMQQMDKDGLLTYRPPNNPYVGRLLEKARRFDPRLSFTTKSEKGVRDMIDRLRKGQSIGLLVDQKYNRGVEAPFFGVPAKTSTVFVDLALKYNANLVPLQIRRKGGAYFDLIVHSPVIKDGQSVDALIHQTHILLEQWITENPQDWLWLHRRWGREVGA